MSTSTRDPYTGSDIKGLLAEEPQSAEPLEDISVSSCIYEPVIVGLEENKRHYRLEKIFDPRYDQEIIVIDKDENSLIFPIEELQFLSFGNIPLQIDPSKIRDIVVLVETCRGGSFKVRIPSDQDFETGFFGFSVNPEDSYRYVFFPHNNIRIVCQQRPIGDILVEKKFLSEDGLNNILRKQYQLRCLRLGTIIAKRASLQPQDIENAIQDAGLKKSTAKPRIGEILVVAGLVSSQLVNQALELQNKIRHMRVGELFVEMGYITEEQLYIALAEKFKKRYVNLQNSRPDRDALASLPQNFIQELEIISIHFQQERLVIATSDPSNAHLVDILREVLSRPFEMVISPQSQIISALAELSV
jgi:MshEN domain